MQQESEFIYYLPQAATTVDSSGLVPAGISAQVFAEVFPPDSPIAEIARLRKNWDGRGAGRPDDVTLTLAQELLEYAKKLAGDDESQQPHVYPGHEENVCFLWKSMGKRLDIFIHDGSPFRAEYSLELGGKEQAGECQSLIALFRVLRQFMVA